MTVYERPGLHDFLLAASQLGEVILFTAGLEGGRAVCHRRPGAWRTVGVLVLPIAVGVIVFHAVCSWVVASSATCTAQLWACFEPILCWSGVKCRPGQPSGHASGQP